MTEPELADESIAFLAWIMGKALRGLLLEDRDEFLWPKASKRCTKIETVQVVLLASTSNSGTTVLKATAQTGCTHSFQATAFVAHCWGKFHDRTPWKNPT